MLYVGGLRKYKCRICFHSNLLLFFSPSQYFHFPATVVMRNNLGEHQQGVRKNYIAIICTRNPFKHFFTSYLPPAQFYTPQKIVLPLLTSLCPSQCLQVVSWVWSFFLVFKYIPCLGEKQRIKATRPKMGY